MYFNMLYGDAIFNDMREKMKLKKWSSTKGKLISLESKQDFILNMGNPN